LRLPQPAEKWLPAEIQANDYRPLSITIEHALTTASLPRHHEDPFDRMLIAQAQIEDLRILTADGAFAAYGIKLIDATV
jgi:PIN domain nuclease of toxin-antitoxin system